MEKLNRYRFVIDKENRIVKGIVSNTYLEYSNYDFIMDIKRTFMDIYTSYTLIEGYNYNSKLYMRLSSDEISCGRIHGLGGEGGINVK